MTNEEMTNFIREVHAFFKKMGAQLGDAGDVPSLQYELPIFDRPREVLAMFGDLPDGFTVGVSVRDTTTPRQRKLIQTSETLTHLKGMLAKVEIYSGDQKTIGLELVYPWKLPLKNSLEEVLAYVMKMATFDVQLLEYLLNYERHMEDTPIVWVHH